MKYTITALFCFFLLNVNFAQSEITTTRAERSQLGQMQQTTKTATKTFMTSLDRYREAVKMLDVESQAEIKKDMLMRMTKVISAEKHILKEAPRSDANKNQMVEIKNKLTQQNLILKKAEKSSDAQETERLIAEFLETL